MTPTHFFLIDGNGQPAVGDEVLAHGRKRGFFLMRVVAAEPSGIGSLNLQCEPSGRVRSLPEAERDRLMDVLFHVRQV